MAGNFELACRQLGEAGPPLIFLHGLAGSGRYWDRRVAPLATEFRLYLLDLLGFGQSPWPEVTYDVSTHVAAIRATVERLGLDEAPLLVGHSLGAILAAEYAAQFTSEVRGLMLFNLPCYRDADEARELIKQQGGLPALTVTNRRLAALT